MAYSTVTQSTLRSDRMQPLSFSTIRMSNSPGLSNISSCWPTLELSGFSTFLPICSHGLWKTRQVAFTPYIISEKSWNASVSPGSDASQQIFSRLFFKEPGTKVDAVFFEDLKWVWTMALWLQESKIFFVMSHVNSSILRVYIRQSKNCQLARRLRLLNP